MRMLAGRMKLKHFMVIVVLLGLAGLVGLYATCDGAPEELPKRAKPIAPSDEPTGFPTMQLPAAKPPTPAVAATAAAAGGPSVRPVDQAVMAYQGRDLGSSKQKDVTKGKPYKVNLYQDAGKSSCNRAKVDLDRDDKWDEKWTFDGDAISRKVAPADDENYTDEYLWDGSAWQKQ